ncbi:MauE/DoxX family redox-associated membrane protein [Pokkaliibacter plantistimulans]|nr:MauE/DoxX family redox-associated membrane protein [Pokkaliibacter plantistimulans]
MDHSYDKSAMATMTKPPVSPAASPARLQDGIPLLAVIMLTALAASAKQWAYPGPWEMLGWLHDFVGLLLLLMAMFKVFDLDNFVSNFTRFDFLGRHLRLYAYLYPALEVVLGIGLLSHYQPEIMYIATATLLSFSALGICDALIRGLDIGCPHLGRLLGVRLSLFTLLEEVAIALLALMMLVIYLPSV